MNLKSLLLVISFFLLSSHAVAGSTAQVIYEKANNQREAEIKKEIEQSMENLADFINEQFLLNEPLYLVIGGEDGPLYDQGTNEIFIPYLFMDEVENRFKEANYSETGVSVEDATIDVVMHTLFHELAHALIWNYELPVLGKEEDAADSLAVVLLIEYFENGPEIAISAADLFDLESGDIEEFDEQDFWDEHSLDAQRFYSTLCFVYGSDPEEYSSLKDDLGLSEERAELCIAEYEQVSRSWFDILEPYMKDN